MDDLKTGEDKSYFEPIMEDDDNKGDVINIDDDNTDGEEIDDEEKEIIYFSKPISQDNNNDVYISNLLEDYDTIKYNVSDISDHDEENNIITLSLNDIKHVLYFLKLREFILLNVLENYGKWKNDESLVISSNDLSDTILFNILDKKKKYNINIHLINDINDDDEEFDDESDFESDYSSDEESDEVLDKINELISNIDDEHIDKEFDIKDKEKKYKKNKLSLVSLMFKDNNIIPLFRNN